MKSLTIHSLAILFCICLCGSQAAVQSPKQLSTSGGTSFHFIRGPYRSAFAIMTPHLRQMFVARYAAPAGLRHTAGTDAGVPAAVHENRDNDYETASSQRQTQQVATSLGLGQYANAIPQFRFAQDVRQPALNAIQKALLLQQQQYQQQYYQQQKNAQVYQQQQNAQVYQQQQNQQPQQVYQEPQQSQVYQQPQAQQQVYYQPQSTTGYEQQVSQQQLEQLYQQQYQQQNTAALQQQQQATIYQPQYVAQQQNGPVQFQQQNAAGDINALTEAASEQQNTKLLGVAYSPSTDVSSFQYTSQGLNYNF